MIACVDVGYLDSKARAACVAFDAWDDASGISEYVRDLKDVEPYIPGQFYRRELPCLLSVLGLLPARPEIVVIDGYVWLDEHAGKGLGARLFEALGETVPVVGVAKTRFATATAAREIVRGTSDRPLFISAAGIDESDAANYVQQMHGENRIPTLLRRVDRLTRFGDHDQES